MAIRRRRGSPFWHYDFTLQGRRFRGSCQTAERADAEAVEAKLRHDLLFGLLAGARPRLTLDQAAGLYWDQHARRVRSAADVKRNVRLLLAGLGKATALHLLADADVALYAARRRAAVADASVNRELTTLRALLVFARARLGADVAALNWRAHFLREPEPRARYLSSAEAERLLGQAAPHLRAPVRFALLTGLRHANIVGLDWSQVDLAARQIAFRVKSRAPGGKPHVLPVTGPMLALLAALGPRAAGPVFTYKGRPVRQFRRAWRTALRRAGIEDFRFHDLRHTAASWMVQEGAPLDVVQEVLGHASIATTQRYAHRDTLAKRRAMEAGQSRLGHSGDSTLSADQG